ncbi:MAG: B12-binding domain-containing radical SAM protein [Syntrophales bacterium]|nr:B12-binding domain-containing radical SAM protein [Syntrophales bacterium]
MDRVKVLLVYPEYPNTFWSFRYALNFISKKASHPPLGLLTVAALLPEEWEKRLIDMNVSPLKEEDLQWADYVFVGAMSIQEHSGRDVLRRAKELGKITVAGGPLFTVRYDEFEDVDHFVLNEAEINLPFFIEDLRAGRAKKIYKTDDLADITRTPVPRYDIAEMRKYASMCIQYSRGCPFDCEFCEITFLFGRRPRTKEGRQIINELEFLYKLGWRGSVFFVDDNFVGNRRKLKEDLMPLLIAWQKKKNYPYTFYTEASINVSDDEELMDLMVQAGFNALFVGIESPHVESLEECGKNPNVRRNLLESVKKIQTAGFDVQGGFIVGFDNDPPNIFDKIVDFVMQSNIVTAMVGLLNAPEGTRLYRRLKNEGRILKFMTGDNTDFCTNVIPKMGLETLIKGYERIVKTLYMPKMYYKRVKGFLKVFEPRQKRIFHIKWMHIEALVKSMFVLGLKEKGRWEYWKLFFWSLIFKPRIFPLSITFAIYGYHFRKVFER